MAAPVHDTSFQCVITLVGKSTEGAAEVEEDSDSDYVPETESIEAENEGAAGKDNVNGGEDDEAEEDQDDEAVIMYADESHTTIKMIRGP